MDRVVGFLKAARGRSALILVPNVSQASHLKRILLTGQAGRAGTRQAGDGVGGRRACDEWVGGGLDQPSRLVDLHELPVDNHTDAGGEGSGVLEVVRHQEGG